MVIPFVSVTLQKVRPCQDKEPAGRPSPGLKWRRESSPVDLDPASLPNPPLWPEDGRPHRRTLAEAAVSQALVSINTALFNQESSASVFGARRY